MSKPVLGNFKDQFDRTVKKGVTKHERYPKYARRAPGKSAAGASTLELGSSSGERDSSIPMFKSNAYLLGVKAAGLFKG